jgi:hypothetical protein
MGMPMIIGAGVGALSSAAMGKNPFTGALLGGVTGGAFGGAGGFGSGFSGNAGGLLSGLKGVAPEAVSLGSGGYSTLGSNAFGGIGGVSSGIQLKPLMTQAVNTADDIIANPNLIDDMVSRGFNGTNLPPNNQIAFKDFYPTTNLTDDGLSFGKPLSSADQMFANKFVTEQNPFAVDPRRMVVDTPLSFGERLSDLGSNTMSYAKENPMTVLSGGKSLLDIRQQNEMADQQKIKDAMALAQPIRKNQFGPMAGNLLQVKRIG